MKVAINTCTHGGYAHYRGTKLTAEAFFRDAAEAGYDGVELGGGERFLGTPTQCLRRLAKCGLAVAAYDTSVTYNPHQPNTRAYQADIRYGQAVGATVLMTCGGFMYWHRRNTYPGDYDLFADNLGRATDYAARHGMTLAFHPHCGSIVETAAETRQMLRRLPELKLCVDIAHLEAAGEDARRYCRQFRRQIVYTHIKDFSHRHNSFIELGRGDGKLDVAACVGELARAKYDGWLTVELDRGEKEFRRVGLTALESARRCRRYLRTKCGV